MKRYEKYKDSGIEWIGEVPENWRTSKLKYETTCLDGKRVPVEKSIREEGPFPYWGAGSITCYVNDYLFDEELVLLGEDGAPFFDPNRPVSFYVNEKVWVNNHIHVLKAGHRMTSKYMTYLLNIVDYHRFINGSVLTKLTQSSMDEIPFILPSKEEQREIAEYLDYKVGKIDKAVEGINAQIEDLKGYRQSVISEAVTKGVNRNVKMKDSGVEWIGEIPGSWNVNRLRELCSIFGRIGFRGYTLADLVSKGEGAITLSPSNFSNGLLDYSKCSYISWNKYYESPEIMIDNGDVLLVKTASIGKVALVTNMPEKCTLNPQIVVLKDLNIDNRFLAYALQTPYLQSQVESNAIGSTIKTLSQEKIGKFNVCVPPINEQEEIASYLDEKTSKIDKAIKALEMQREDLGALKQSVISEAVTGKVDVRGWNN